MKKIDLHLPNGWNQCTTDELEMIAAAIIAEQQRVDRYHPFDWQRVKLRAVLAINNLSVVSVEGSTDDDDPDQTYIVNRSKEEGDFPISVGQLLSLTEHLAFITDEKAAPLWRFPYPELEVKGQRSKDKGEKNNLLPLTSNLLPLQGPYPLLDGYSWREYRLLTDWMQEYMRSANAMAQSKREDVRSKNQAALDKARNEFLAILFKPKAGGGRNNDISTYRDNGNIPAAMFNDFSPVKWQVILFWWSGLMAQLAKKFPRVFKVQPVKKSRKGKQHTSPWDFYNSVTASIQKYIGGLSAQDVDNQPYGVTLQQLEMMAKESEEIEKMKK